MNGMDEALEAALEFFNPVRRVIHFVSELESCTRRLNRKQRQFWVGLVCLFSSINIISIFIVSSNPWVYFFDLLCIIVLQYHSCIVKEDDHGVEDEEPVGGFLSEAHKVDLVVNCLSLFYLYNYFTHVVVAVALWKPICLLFASVHLDMADQLKFKTILVREGHKDEDDDGDDDKEEEEEEEEDKDEDNEDKEDEKEEKEKSLFLAHGPDDGEPKKVEKSLVIEHKAEEEEKRKLWADEEQEEEEEKLPAMDRRADEREEEDEDGDSGEEKAKNDEKKSTVLDHGADEWILID